MSPLATSIRFLQTQPDQRLVELAHAGHERAFEALVHRYRKPLLAYCRRLLLGEANAEDVLQQALLQAWVAIRRDEIKDVRPWLYRIVHNIAVSNLRRAGADVVTLERAVEASGGDTEAEQRLEVHEALAGLAALPELQRKVMLSAALEGRSHEEIAGLLGLSHGAVRGLMYRARAALRSAAAALIPGPVISWAARQEIRGSSNMVETIAGGGAAGVGGLLIKGTAVVVTVGGLAGAVGQSLHLSGHRPALGHTHTLMADSGEAGLAAVSSGRRAAAISVLRAGAHGSTGSSNARGHFVLLPSTSGRTASRSPGGPAGRFSGTAAGGSLNGGGGPSSSHGHGGGGSASNGGPSTTGSGHDGGSGSGGGTGSGSGHDGGSSGGSDGGSSGGSDGGSSGGSDGGSSGGSAGGATSGHDGGSSGGSDGGSTGSGGGPDGGSSGGGGSDGGTTTTFGVNGGGSRGDPSGSGGSSGGSGGGD